MVFSQIKGQNKPQKRKLFCSSHPSKGPINSALLARARKRPSEFHISIAFTASLSRTIRLCGILVLLWSCGAVETVDGHAAKDLIRSGYLYLDVSLPRSIERCLCLPIKVVGRYCYCMAKNPKFMEQVASLCKRDDHLVVEYKHVKDMEGGYAAWVERGFAVEKTQVELRVSGMCELVLVS